MNTNIKLERETQMNAIVRRFAQIGVLIIVQAAILFLAAGRIDWAQAWAYMILYVAVIALNASIMLPRNSDLIAERGQIKEDAKGWDKRMGVLTGITGLAVLVVCGLDERFNWSPPFDLTVQVVGFVVMALGFLFFSWAMASNRFFSAIVRIQKDRGHTVIASGPYRLVRHPGYIGIIAYTLATPFLLGSLWGLIPAVLMSVLVVARTRLEDRTLAQELPGYTDYKQRVPYRLVPGVW